MARVCEICGKRTRVGNRISHAHNKNKRKFKPNIQKVRAQLPNGEVRRIKVCTRCIRSGAVQKPVKA